jgi:hypothetical protein
MRRPRRNKTDLSASWNWVNCQAWETCISFFLSLTALESLASRIKEREWWLGGRHFIIIWSSTHHSVSWFYTLSLPLTVGSKSVRGKECRFLRQESRDRNGYSQKLSFILHFWLLPSRLNRLTPRDRVWEELIWRRSREWVTAERQKEIAVTTPSTRNSFWILCLLDVESIVTSWRKTGDVSLNR